ncbi:uncharacterized protein LOC126846801 [Adelges cooleyi]|uniref:uncharacterized protein LOC126846801 n=1 Tax=Adelges cooleyi TaxID=133065 RepID=UPI0021800FE8|nr:uncharacterized protein LOC126846801 [Adelges cooleyi]
MKQKLGVFFVLLTVVFEITAFTEISLPMSEIIKDNNEKLKKLAPHLEGYSKLGEYNSRFIDALNSFKTMNSHQIEFDSNEITVMTSKDHSASLIKKQFIQLKYFRKMQDFQCTHYAILQCLIPHVKYLAERLVLWADYGTPKFSFHVVMKFVYDNFLKTTFEGNYVIYTWLWELYIKLVAFSYWEDWYAVLTEDTFGFVTLEANLDELIEQCQRHRYLIEGYKEKYNLINVENDFKYLRNVIMKSYSLSVGAPGQEDSDEYAAVEQFFLKPFWRDIGLIFLEVHGVQIQWDTVKKTLNEQQDRVELQFQNGSWITNPYDNVVYQHMFLDIIKVHVLCLVRLHLFVYRNQDDGVRSEIDESDSASKIVESLKLFNVGDKFLNSLLAVFVNFETFNPHELDDVIGQVQDKTKAIVLEWNEFDGKNRELISTDENLTDKKTTLDENTNQTEDRATVTTMTDKGVFIEFANSLDTAVLPDGPVEFLEMNAMKLLKYVNEISSKLKFADLSFFISGSKKTHQIFFPNRL